MAERMRALAGCGALADTNGYQFGGERFMWRWRDWVIKPSTGTNPSTSLLLNRLPATFFEPHSGAEDCHRFNRNRKC
jgi:hypothetical protein